MSVDTKRIFEVAQLPVYAMVFLLVSPTISVWALLVGFVFAYIMMVISQEAAGHRYFSHTSFQVSDAVEKFMFACMIVSANGSPLDWRASHLDHHRNCDTDKDPTSPKRFGKLGIISNYWKLVYVPQQTALKSLLWVSKHKPKWVEYHAQYFKLVLLYQFSMLLLSMLFGAELFVVAVVMPVLLSNIFLNCISAFCHRSDYKSETDNHLAVDNRFVNVFSPGAGNHAEHHNYPGNYQSSGTDITAIFINMVRQK
jgi:stearoyl-CoA desaturase (delta-9 desaturase)